MTPARDVPPPPPSPKPVAIPVNQRIITWDEHGQPVLTAQPVISKQQIQSLYMVVAAQPYVVDDPLSPDFGVYDGMTVAEVLVRKQITAAAKSGDTSLIEIVMDRLIGKPLTRGENFSVSGSYEDFLKGIETRVKSAPIDVQATPLEPDDGDSLFGDLVGE